MPYADLNFVAESPPKPVCAKGDFPFAATNLDHAHIYGQCRGLIEAGGELRWVYDSDSEKISAFRTVFPQVQPASSLGQILDDPQVKLIAAAAVPNLRCSLGRQVMEAGKDYFTDKTPLTSLAQLKEARAVVKATARKYMVYYSERLHVECAVMAEYLINHGAIGDVIQVVGFGPHRLNRSSRPDWFFRKSAYGGILCDIGSHQSEQFLFYTNSTDASVRYARTSNFENSDKPEFQDFGEASLVGSCGSSGYYRVDWLTPDGLGTWGDNRTFIYGTKGYIELRKTINIATTPSTGEQLYLVDQQGEHLIYCKGKTGYPFFGRLILDCLERTETAMTQEHAFKAAELCLIAQELADNNNLSA